MLKFNTRVAASVLLSLSVFPSACGKSKAVTAAEPLLVTDEAELSKRFDKTQSEVPFTDMQDQTNLGLLDTFTALQVGALTPPTIGGQVVQANAGTVSGIATYVGYNAAGDTYDGGIDVIDVTTVASLQLLSSLYLPGSDINGLFRYGFNLYAVGVSEDTGGGFVDRIALGGISGNLLTAAVTQKAIAGYAGTSIVANAANIYTTSGDNAGVTVFDTATLTQSAYTPIPDARSVAVTTTGVPMVLSGQPGKVSVLTATGAVSSSFTLGGAATAQSKSTVVVGSKWSVASLGEGGLTVFCNSNGTAIAHVDQPIVSGLAAAKTVTNSLTVLNGLVYAANGEAGVYVYALRQTSSAGACGTGALSLIGSFSLGSGASANGVYSNGLFLYVAHPDHCLLHFQSREQQRPLT